MGKIVKSVVHAVTSIFGSDDQPQQQAAPAPVVAPVTPMPSPLPDDTAVAAAKRKSIAELQSRQGRASTILTGTDSASDSLGTK